MFWGMIIGDIVGSIYEFSNIKTKQFPFFPMNGYITDDSCMTIAVADALMKWKHDGGDLQQLTIQFMREIERDLIAQRTRISARFILSCIKCIKAHLVFKTIEARIMGFFLINIYPFNINYR